MIICPYCQTHDHTVDDCDSIHCGLARDTCPRCQDDPKMTHDDCLYTEADAYEDARIARAKWALEDAKDDAS